MGVERLSGSSWGDQGRLRGDLELMGGNSRKEGKGYLSTWPGMAGSCAGNGSDPV